MYHITTSQSGKFYTVLLGKNGEVLSTSELLETRLSAVKNIIAQAVATDSMPFFQDDTVKKLKVKRVLRFGKDIEIVETGILTKPRYIPGKNPKKKK